jgi:septal ring factor EnvC (AmiA/AmiB activator)
MTEMGNAETGTAKKSSYREGFSSFTSSIESRLPTMDKSLDRYFDAHMSAIISEWSLLTQNQLDEYDKRLTRVSGEIANLEKGRAQIEKRAADLEAGIKALEGS